MRKLFQLLLLLCFIDAERAGAQVLNGTWTGNYSKQLLSMNPETLIVELTVYNDSLITGLSHLYYENKQYEHHKIKGLYNPKDSSAVFEESYISSNLFAAGVMEVKYKMKLYPQEGKWRLEGKWKGVKSILGYMSGHKVWLEKPRDTIAKEKIRDTVSVSIPAATDATDKKLQRVTDVEKVIEIKQSEKDSVKISIYDNGEVDGDSISVYKDDELIIKNKMITVKPIIIYLSLDKVNSFHKIKMIAENLGSVPPNTALMIVETATKRYEVNMSSNYEKNAAIEFVLVE